MEMENEELKPNAFQITLDFETLQEWRDTDADDLPVHSMISFYRASGVLDHILSHKEQFGDQVAAIDCISCNFYTQQRIKKFIMERWGIFSLSLVDNNKVVWNTRTYPKGVEHYHRSPSNKIKKSVGYDFINYCPRLDDELPDNIIEIIIPKASNEAELKDI